MLLLALFWVALGASYTKITHKLDPEAKCLDGSSPAIYLHQADPNNILIYIQGGGVCGGSSLQ